MSIKRTVSTIWQFMLTWIQVRIAGRNPCLLIQNKCDLMSAVYAGTITNDSEKRVSVLTNYMVVIYKKGFGPLYQWIDNQPRISADL
ncbi:MAG: hypothetical protein ACJAZF_004397 [Granulosicoccus sp.]|jgi:hypothetical protein